MMLWFFLFVCLDIVANSKGLVSLIHWLIEKLLVSVFYLKMYSLPGVSLSLGRSLESRRNSSEGTSSFRQIWKCFTLLWHFGCGRQESNEFCGCKSKDKIVQFCFHHKTAVSGLSVCRHEIWKGPCLCQPEQTGKFSRCFGPQEVPIGAIASLCNPLNVVKTKLP